MEHIIGVFMVDMNKTCTFNLLMAVLRLLFVFHNKQLLASAMYQMDCLHMTRKFFLHGMIMTFTLIIIMSMNKDQQIWIL